MVAQFNKLAVLALFVVVALLSVASAETTEKIEDTAAERTYVPSCPNYCTDKHTAEYQCKKSYPYCELSLCYSKYGKAYYKCGSKGYYPPRGYPPHGYPPHGKYPHGKYPHGKYPHGKYPHGKYPHGKYPKY